jgi:hypothetical protein
VEEITPIATRCTRSELIDRAGPTAAKEHLLSFCTALVPAMLLLLVATSSFSFAQQALSTESQVKAAYLYNFGKFVRWQGQRAGSSSDTLVICVLGRDPFGAILDSTVAGERIDGKKIAVSRPARVQEAAPCDILFVSSSEDNRLAQVLAAAQRFGTLTVSDLPHFAERGGIIGFVVLQGRIRFEVNLRAAEQSHLALGSGLLKVASTVIDKSAEGRHP